MGAKIYKLFGKHIDVSQVLVVRNYCVMALSHNWKAKGFEIARGLFTVNLDCALRDAPITIHYKLGNYPAHGTYWKGGNPREFLMSDGTWREEPPVGGKFVDLGHDPLVISNDFLVPEDFQEVLDVRKEYYTFLQFWKEYHESQP